jgi:hypothetical protein
VKTERTISDNKPDNKISGSKKGNIAYSGDKYVTEKETDRILKYKGIITDIQCMWNVKAKLIPVIIGATGTVANSLRQYQNNISGKYEIKKKKKTAILCTAHLPWEVLM